MKKLLLFFLFIPFLGCNSILDRNKEITLIQCPNVFFSLENNVFLYGDKENTDLEKISYKASLNNYGFSDNCSSDQFYNNYPIDLLVLIEPFKPKDSNINLPIFILFYDENNNVIEKQYFRIIGKLKYNNESSLYNETEVLKNLNITVENKKNVNSLTIGFVKIN